jgi:hypothetical protein
MLIAFLMLAAYQGTFPKQKGCKDILPDTNNSPVCQLEEWKRMVGKKKKLWEERKEKGKRRSENTQQHPCLGCERKNLVSQLGPYWALSLGFMRGFTPCILSTLGVCAFLASHIT